MIRDGPPAFVLLFRASHWLGWICLCAVFTAVAIAQAPPHASESLPAKSAANEEPITPIPQPPAADPLKLANADTDVVSQFLAAYGRPPERDNFLDALVTFEQSLLTPGSRFDRWLGGDASALSDDELDGYRLFKSFGCISCHQGVNVGGNLFERQGVFRQLVAAPPETVRVPSLRNVAATAPYFHDGSAPTLEEAVRRMAAAQLNRTLRRLGA
jgi:cytochrome c peroxidase